MFLESDHAGGFSQWTLLVNALQPVLFGMQINSYLAVIALCANHAFKEEIFSETQVFVEDESEGVYIQSLAFPPQLLQVTTLRCCIGLLR